MICCASIPLHHPARIMYMPYTTNPHLPRLRLQAAKLVLRESWSTRQVSRYTGFNQSTIVRWVEKARHTRNNTIPTRSSRPWSHPRQLSESLVDTVIDYRLKHRRCAKVLHYLLLKDGHQLSLSSVERVLRRHQLVYHSRWKKWHTYPVRPLPERPGVLVQIDTSWDGLASDRLYIYALIDLCSRWGFARPVARITARQSLEFALLAQKTSPFVFQMFQSDHGSEFSKWFTKQLLFRGLAHRHSRIRTPSDNGHVERFIRTLQEECLSRIPRKIAVWEKEIPEYLDYYNRERPHLALGMKTPFDILNSQR